jgi:hypothetical protein
MSWMRCKSVALASIGRGFSCGLPILHMRLKMSREGLAELKEGYHEKSSKGLASLRDPNVSLGRQLNARKRK